jgi:uncharacterized membrane protein
MDVYEVLKYLHIVAAIIWLGGAAMLNVMGTMIIRKGDPQELQSFGARIEWFGTRYFTPFSVFVLIFGVAMVAESEVWKFSDAWIVIGLLGIASTIATGAGFLGPASGRLAKAMAGGASTAEIRPQVNRILMVARVDLLVLFLVVADMVFRPGV